jgi:hypothetical protein
LSERAAGLRADVRKLGEPIVRIRLERGHLGRADAVRLSELGSVDLIRPDHAGSTEVWRLGSSPRLNGDSLVGRRFDGPYRCSIARSVMVSWRAVELDRTIASVRSLTQRTDPVAVTAAMLAAVLGLASAGVSAYWAVGGDGLLDTVGGDIERWGRGRGATVVIVLWLIVALKAIVALAAPILVGVGSGRLPSWTTGRVPRALGWIAALTLTVYGGVLTIVGLLVEAGVVNASANADSTALAWHAYFWDPWFAIWGIAFVVALWRSRHGEPNSSTQPGSLRK